jgi:DNA transformation protein
MAHGLKILLEEVLAPLGPVATKRMFGVYGLVLDGLMFGIIAGDRLYLKVGATNQAAFEAEGMEPFTYTRKGEIATLASYRRAPERLVDEPDELIAWARAAHDVAVAARMTKARQERKPSKAPRASSPVRRTPARRDRRQAPGDR